MIKGTRRALEERPSVKANLNASIHNRFDIEVVDAKTGKVKQKAQAFNVICNTLWSYALKTDAGSSNTSSMYFQYIRYGSGAGTPAATDTNLFNQVGYKSAANTVFTEDKENLVYSVRKSISILESEHVGVELTEVGISKNSSSGLCTHAMLQDMNGNPISILKTDTDIINIYATVYAHFPEKYRTFSEDNNIMLANMDQWARHFCGIDNESYYPRVPSQALLHYAPTLSGGNDTFKPVGASVTIDAASRKATYKYNRFTAAYNNLPGGSRYVTVGNAGSTSGYIGTALAVIKTPGTTVHDEAVGTGDGTTVDFATKFDCPKNATVKVDGAAVSARVEPAPTLYQSMNSYFLEIELVNGVPTIAYKYSGSSLRGATTVDEENESLNWSTYYNPYYEYGIASVYLGAAATSSSSFKVLVSDDLSSWTEIRGSKGRVNVPEACQYFRYWKVRSFTGTDNANSFYAKDLNGTNIHFDTPPADGAVITIDYETETLGKDENHVYDFEFSFTLGEYTE